jgi:undecaprenyl-diphosphatase
MPVVLAGAAAAAVFAVTAWLIVAATDPAARRVSAGGVVRRVVDRLVAGDGRLTRGLVVQLLILAAGAALVIALGALFADVTEAVMDSDDLTVVDRPVLMWLAAHRSPALTRVQVGFADLGGDWVLAVVLAVVAVLVGIRLRSWRPVLLVAIGAGGIQLLVYVVKALVGRSRPDPTQRLVDTRGFSFPSGHSASAVVFVGVLAWLVYMVTARSWVRVTAWVAAAVLTLAVGVSRAYLGVHYPSDVVGGWILGATWLTAVAVAARAIQATSVPTVRDGPPAAGELPP